MQLKTFVLLLLSLASINMSYSSEISTNFPLIFVGDLQRTSWMERVIGREQNDAQRNRIINEIAIQGPSAVSILGDLVFRGANKRSWKKYDELVTPLIKNEVLLLPVLGNHDYAGGKRRVLANFYQRFPHLESSHWYIRSYGSIALIYLDSNINKLSSIQWAEQKRWYEENLNQLEDNSAVDAIIVMAHHPPYTNSNVTSDEVHVQKAFLASFFASSKTKIFLSGHVHGYERFEKKGKTFIVSGGGGGPRVQYLTVKRHEDLYSRDSSKRPFHFIKIELQSEYFIFSVLGFENLNQDLFELERLTFPLN